MDLEGRGHVAETPLPAGRITRGIVRCGGHVLRSTGSWSGAVHGHLRDLEAGGFAGAPRLLGTEGNREILTFVEGQVPADPRWRPGRGHRLPSYEFVPLAAPDQLREAGFDPVPDIAARLRQFVDAHGLRSRRTVVPALQRCRLLAAERVKYAPVTAAEAADALEHHARELRWLQSAIPGLERQLVP